MLALIMAGGEGKRLNMGEKPLVTICGKPMIWYVIEAFKDAGCEVVVVASSHTPLTKNWCRAQGVELFNASGAGYVEDIIETVSELEWMGSLFTCVSDLPCLSADIIATILDSYKRSGKEACSTWVPHSLCREYDCRTLYTEMIGGIEVCPAGINILSGDRITEVQDELGLVLNEWRLAFNINTKEELLKVQQFICPEDDPASK